MDLWSVYITSLISYVLQYDSFMILCVVSIAVTGHSTMEGTPTSLSLSHCEVVPTHVLHEAGRWDPVKPLHS